jgi:hypothetical protein
MSVVSEAISGAASDSAHGVRGKCEARHHRPGKAGSIMYTARIIGTSAIAAALIAVSAGLVLSSCASRQLPEPAVEQLTDSQIAEQRAGYLDLTERRAEMYRELAETRSDDIGETLRRYLDEHRGDVYLDDNMNLRRMHEELERIGL